jgi:predicted acetyltransferase
MRFRRATEDDLDRLIEIHTSAFPDPRPYDARARNFTHNALGALDDLRVVDDGGIVAHAFLFPLEATFGSAKVRAGGIASVGVAPEARGRGIAAALLSHLHDESLARGDAIDILYPFRQAFYARHGYGTTSPMRHLVFAPSAVPPAWSKARVRRMEVRDQGAVAAVYERAAARGSGSLSRNAAFWAGRLLDERRVWLVVEGAGGDVAGYVSWSVEQAESHAKTTMTVHEIVTDDDVARRALFGAIGAQRDQVVEVRVAVDAGDPVERALVDADRGISGTAEIEHSVGTLASGPMVRIVDLERAAGARGYAVDGHVSLAIDGRAAVGVRVDAGRGRITDGSGPTLTTDSATLASILYGALAPSDAARLGLATTAGEAKTLDAIFRLPPYFALDPF